MLILNEFISAVLQVLAFSLIPFLVYVIQHKSGKGFLDYIGLKASNKKANLWGLAIMLLIAVPILLLATFHGDFKEILINPSSVTGKIRDLGFGVDTVAILLMIAVIKTSLAEEIFFRGFLAKRLIAITNFQIGNTIQAVIFGVIHTLLFMSITSNALFLFVIFFFPALAAYFKTYVNEKLADGSIIPSWIAHASGNMVAYSFVGFLM